MVGAIGFEFSTKRCFNDIERTAGTVKQCKAVVNRVIPRRGRSNLYGLVGLRVPASEWPTIRAQLRMRIRVLTTAAVV